jgi:hypothetical protein
MDPSVELKFSELCDRQFVPVDCGFYNQIQNTPGENLILLGFALGKSP